MTINSGGDVGVDATTWKMLEILQSYSNGIQHQVNRMTMILMVLVFVVIVQSSVCVGLTWWSTQTIQRQADKTQALVEETRSLAEKARDMAESAAKISERSDRRNSDLARLIRKTSGVQNGAAEAAMH